MLLAVADEEVGDEKVGMPWLVEERADLAPDVVVGEGSGERLPTSAGLIYMLDHGVKASSSATLTVHGSSGDASLRAAATTPSHDSASCSPGSTGGHHRSTSYPSSSHC